MIDIRTMRNEEIIRTVRRKLRYIICDHVKNYDDENAMKHIEMFMEGLSWATGLRYVVSADGEIYVYLKCLNRANMRLFDERYKVIDVHLDIKILRNSINRHYAKMDWSSAEEVCFDEWH